MQQLPSTIVHPSPYGVPATLHRLKDADPRDIVNGWGYDIESTAIMAGIHDRNAWKELEKIAVSGGPLTLDKIFELGGHVVPREKLPVPLKPVYNTLPKEHIPGLVNDHGVSMRDCADQWTTMLADESDWADKATVFLDMVERQRKAVPNVANEVAGIALGSMITVALEGLGETEIECLEAAAFYMLTHHEGWRTVARNWLLPFRKTWFADWIAARPDYRRIAKLIATVHDDVPTWACRVTR
ncbi:MAG: hypothetical protein LDL26_00040 [Caenispirillum bisanense]|nr:hypothetical protein [Caenispirillum bisanense]MCA1971258.1 hypothetical protein [Caenispirillum sp.]